MSRSPTCPVTFSHYINGHPNASSSHFPPLLLQVRDKKRAEIKKLQDDFRALLESVDPPITVDSEWEDVKEGLIGKPTFDSMPRNDRYDAFKVCNYSTSFCPFKVCMHMCSIELELHLKHIARLNWMQLPPGLHPRVARNRARKEAYCQSGAPQNRGRAKGRFGRRAGATARCGNCRSQHRV